MSRTISLAALAIALAGTVVAGTPTVCYSPDVAKEIGTMPVFPSDTLCKNTAGMMQPGDLPAALSGLRGANLDALARSDGLVVFSLDTTVILQGYKVDPGDVYRCIDAACSGFTVLLNGVLDLPRNANVDAVAISPDTGFLLYSLDAGAIIDGTPYLASDVIRWDGSAHTLAFDGKLLPGGVNVDAIDVLAGQRLVFSIDVPADIGSGQVKLHARSMDLIESVLGSGTFEFADKSLQPDPTFDYSRWRPDANLDALELRGDDVIFADGFEV